MVLNGSDQVGFRGHVGLANGNVGNSGVNREGFEQRPASGIRAETSQDKPADKEKPCKRRQPAEHPANGRKRSENRAEKQKAAETGARQVDQHAGQDHPRGNEHIYKVGHSEKAVTMKCPALPNAGANDRAETSRPRKATTAWRVRTQAQATAATTRIHTMVGIRRNPFFWNRDGRGVCLRCYLGFPDMIVLEVTDGSDADG